MGETMNKYTVLVIKLQGKRLLGKCSVRGQDNIFILFICFDMS
jgi:hypothetical protein